MPLATEDAAPLFPACLRAVSHRYGWAESGRNASVRSRTGKPQASGSIAPKGRHSWCAWAKIAEMPGSVRFRRAALPNGRIQAVTATKTGARAIKHRCPGKKRPSTVCSFVLARLNGPKGICLLAMGKTRWNVMGLPIAREGCHEMLECCTDAAPGHFPSLCAR